MFRWIEGTVVDKSFNDLVINSGGVGYRVFASPSILNHFHIGKLATLWLYTSVRETAIDIYGFLNKDELSFFELLLTINGIGPKSAISIMSAASLEIINDGLMSGDSAYFSKITGIGKKTAEKIMIGLKDKIGVVDSTSAQGAGSFAIDALTALGYSERDARDAVQKIKKEKGEGNESTEDIVKEALKNLGKSK
jgi:Holliday junction DNA helicase RuvA